MAIKTSDQNVYTYVYCVPTKLYHGLHINFLYYIDFRVLLHAEVNKGFDQYCTISEYYLLRI